MISLKTNSKNRKRNKKGEKGQEPVCVIKRSHFIFITKRHVGYYFLNMDRVLQWLFWTNQELKFGHSNKGI